MSTASISLSVFPFLIFLRTRWDEGARQDPVGRASALGWDARHTGGFPEVMRNVL